MIRSASSMVWVCENAWLGMGSISASTRAIHVVGIARIHRVLLTFSVASTALDIGVVAKLDCWAEALPFGDAQSAPYLVLPFQKARILEFPRLFGPRMTVVFK